MAQLILAGITLLALKLIWDVYKDYQIKPNKKKEKGQVIDLSEAWIDMDNLPYRKKGALLSRADLALFILLNDVINHNNYVVLPKVRLEDIIHSAPNVQNAEEYLLRLKDKSADFLICNLPDLEPKLVIVSENPQDNRIKQLSDTFNKRASEEAGLTVISINNNNLPTHPELTLLLKKYGVV